SCQGIWLAFPGGRSTPYTGSSWRISTGGGRQTAAFGFGGGRPSVCSATLCFCLYSYSVRPCCCCLLHPSGNTCHQNG
uniref:Uncharacterized protein n=1 Tax=Aegilops tauschii subsp. strangulata TaxID=200361 RepID=A0A453MNS4_AEGTS